MSQFQKILNFGPAVGGIMDFFLNLLHFLDGFPYIKFYIPGMVVLSMCFSLMGEVAESKVSNISQILS